MLETDKVKKALINFFNSGTRIFYKKGEVIVRPQDEPSGIFFIDSGFVKAYSITKYGEENLLLVRGKGAVFPLIWAFTDDHRDISYEAMEATVLYRIGKKDYLKFLEDNPDILPAILDMSIEAYRLHSERVMTLSYRTVRERVVSFLVTCADRFGEKSKAGILINAPFKQHDIASSVNATRETTSREINSLKAKGLIDIKDQKIVILDIEKLRSFL